MTIRIRGLVANNNGGDGIRIEGDVQLDAEGIRAEGNGGQGVSILRHASLLEQLGLPKETDPHALARLLQELQSTPPEKRAEAVRSSGILQRMGRGVIDLTTVTSNILSVVTNPAVQDVVKRLLHGA